MTTTETTTDLTALTEQIEAAGRSFAPLARRIGEAVETVKDVEPGESEEVDDFRGMLRCLLDIGHLAEIGGFPMLDDLSARQAALEAEDDPYGDQELFGVTIPADYRRETDRHLRRLARIRDQIRPVVEAAIAQAVRNEALADEVRMALPADMDSDILSDAKEGVATIVDYLTGERALFNAISEMDTWFDIDAALVPASRARWAAKHLADRGEPDFAEGTQAVVNIDGGPVTVAVAWVTDAGRYSVTPVGAPPHVRYEVTHDQIKAGLIE